jgi:flagellar protein FlaF
MGLSQVATFSLIAFLALSLLLTYLILQTRDQQLLDNSYQQRQQLYLNQLNTRISILSTSVRGSMLTLSVANNGTVPLWDFSHFSLVIQYYANQSGVKVLSLSSYNYTPSLTPPAYYWTSASVIPPGGWTYFTVSLPYPPYSGTQAVIVISTNYGPGTVWRGAL